MGRNRVIGAPYQTQDATADFVTNHAVDAYLVAAVPLVVTLDPFAVNFDQVLIQDVTNDAATHPILIVASEGQTILNGYGASISIATNGGAVLLTMTPAGWVPQPSATGSGTTGATGMAGPPGATGATGGGTTGATGVGTTIQSTTVTVGAGEKLVISAGGIIGNPNAAAGCDLQIVVDGTAEAFAPLFVPTAFAGLAGPGYSMLFETAALAAGGHTVEVQGTPGSVMVALTAQLQILRVLV